LTDTKDLAENLQNIETSGYFGSPNNKDIGG